MPSRFFGIIAMALAAFPLEAQSALEIAQRAQQRSRSQSEHYQGTLRVVNAKGNVTEKQWTFDRIGSHGDSKSILRFTAPPEVKNVALLIVNHPDRAADEWMWTPALERDRRIALQDRSGRFFGTDFSFEDLEERDTGQFEYKLMGEEAMGGSPCWKLESRPKQTKSSQYSSSILWIRKDNYVVVRIDNFRKDKMIRRIEYGEIENIQNIWTPKRIQVADPERSSRTVLNILNLRYNMPLKESDFTIEALRRGL